MEYKGCVVVQGQTHPEWITQIKQSWVGYQVIYSTWDNSDKNLYDESDIVIYNPIPEKIGVGNLNLQKISTVNGFMKAKELGWNKALKWRSDMIPNNPDELFKLFKSDKLNIYAWVNHMDGYVCDYFMEGICDDMIMAFDFVPEGLYPEYVITKQIWNSGLNKKLNTIFSGINKEVDVEWLKYGYSLSRVENQSGVFNSNIPNSWID
jgi:hypothetical protein